MRDRLVGLGMVALGGVLLFFAYGIWTGIQEGWNSIGIVVLALWTFVALVVVGTGLYRLLKGKAPDA